MNGPSERALFLHDLRAPLSRARSYAKLLGEATRESELLEELLRALEELERRIQLAEENDHAR